MSRKSSSNTQVMRSHRTLSFASRGSSSGSDSDSSPIIPYGRPLYLYPLPALLPGFTPYFPSILVLKGDNVFTNQSGALTKSPLKISKRFSPKDPLQITDTQGQKAFSILPQPKGNFDILRNNEEVVHIKKHWLFSGVQLDAIAKAMNGLKVTLCCKSEPDNNSQARIFSKECGQVYAMIYRAPGKERDYLVQIAACVDTSLILALTLMFDQLVSCHRHITVLT
jgi:uncharacterized protein YxjI